MGVTYTHLLIPTEPALQPTPEQIMTYFKRVVALPLAQGLHTLRVHIHEPGPVVPEPVAVPTIEQLAALLDHDAYTVEATLRMTPGHSLLSVPILERDEAHAEQYAENPREVIQLEVRRTPVSMSGDDYGQPAEPEPRVGVFRGPNGSVRSIARAGVAKFWIAIPLNEWEVPDLSARNYDIAAVDLVVHTTDVFDVRFAQGWHLG
jgi:hypothetical protein